MNKEFERYLILILLLVLIALSGCAKKTNFVNNPKLPDATTDKGSESHTVIDSISKMEGVANALVCVFSPDTCEATKQERESER